VLKQLAAARPYIDLNRAGVFGGSYGGYFTIRAMLQAPEVFRAGVAAAPLTDLRQVSGASAVYFTGDAAQDKDALEFASNLRLAGNLKGHLLLIHGTSDVNAPLTATMQMIDALIGAGKPYDLILLPGQDHIPAGQAANYSLQQQRKYLVEHLIKALIAAKIESCSNRSATLRERSLAQYKPHGEGGSDRFEARSEAAFVHPRK